MNKSELCLLLARLKAGEVPESEIYGTIHLFGKEGFVEAKPVVEGFLSHPDPELRYIALNVLTLHWGCNEHRNTCEEFLKKDSLKEVRDAQWGLVNEIERLKKALGDVNLDKAARDELTTQLREASKLLDKTKEIIP